MRQKKLNRTYPVRLSADEYKLLKAISGHKKESMGSVIREGIHTTFFIFSGHVIYIQPTPEARKIIAEKADELGLEVNEYCKMILYSSLSIPTARSPERTPSPTSSRPQ